MRTEAKLAQRMYGTSRYPATGIIFTNIIIVISIAAQRIIIFTKPNTGERSAKKKND